MDRSSIRGRCLVCRCWPPDLSSRPGQKEPHNCGQVEAGLDRLREVLRRMHGDCAEMREMEELGALDIWSTAHGFLPWSSSALSASPHDLPRLGPPRRHRSKQSVPADEENLRR